MKARYDVEIQGYIARETDFRVLLARRPILQAPEVSGLIDSAFEAFENANSQKFCAILILGYSDREDSPGLSDAQRRDAELKASQARADSASAWLLDKVNEVAQASGMQLELEWAGVATVVVEAIGVGASNLAASPVTESDRLKNRRIKFVVSGNNVDSISNQNRESIVFPP